MGYPKIVISGEKLVLVYYFNDGPGKSDTSQRPAS